MLLWSIIPKEFFSRNKADVMKDASQDNEKQGQCLRRARYLVSTVEGDQEEVLQRGADWYLQSKAKVPNDMQNFVHSRNIPTCTQRIQLWRTFSQQIYPTSWAGEKMMISMLKCFGSQNQIQLGWEMMTMVKRFGSQGPWNPSFNS